MAEKTGFAKAGIIESAKFVLVFGAVFLSLSYAGSAIGLDRQMALFNADASAAILNALGQKAELFYAGNWPSIMLSSFSAEINYLCTGLLELTVLVSAMLASFGISWKKRGIGIIAGIAAGITFNITRIVLTVLALLYAEAKTAELAHDLLFRLSIILVVAGIYWVWFYWATKAGKSAKQKHKSRG